MKPQGCHRLSARETIPDLINANSDGTVYQFYSSNGKGGGVEVFGGALYMCGTPPRQLGRSSICLSLEIFSIFSHTSFVVVIHTQCRLSNLSCLSLHNSVKLNTSYCCLTMRITHLQHASSSVKLRLSPFTSDTFFPFLQPLAITFLLSVPENLAALGTSFKYVFAFLG